MDRYVHTTEKSDFIRSVELYNNENQLKFRLKKVMYCIT